MGEAEDVERERARQEALRGDEEYQYLSGLGSFIEAYAHFEYALFLLLGKTADIDLDVATAVFSGLNVQQKQSAIRRIWRVNPPSADTRADLEDVFGRSLNITEVRNSMLHFASFVTPNRGRVTSDIRRALRASTAKEFRVDPHILSQMKLDILKCAARMLKYTLSTEALAERTADVDVFLTINRPWLYTHEPSQPRKSSKPKRKGRTQQ